MFSLVLTACVFCLWLTLDTLVFSDDFDFVRYTTLLNVDCSLSVLSVSSFAPSRLKKQLSKTDRRKSSCFSMWVIYLKIRMLLFDKQYDYFFKIF